MGKITDAQRTQYREFCEAVHPKLSEHCAAIRSIFIQTDHNPDAYFTEADVNNGHNALYKLLDLYESLVKSRQHNIQCLQLKPIIEDVMRPVQEYQRKYNIPMTYTRKEYLEEVDAARNSGCDPLLGFEHTEYKAVITRSNAVMSALSNIRGS